MAKILLFGAGTQSLAIIPSLHKAGHIIILLVGFHPNYGDKSRYVNKVYRYNISTKEETLLALQEVITKEHPNVIIPMGDDGAEFLS